MSIYSSDWQAAATCLLSGDTVISDWQTALSGVIPGWSTAGKEPVVSRTVPLPSSRWNRSPEDTEASVSNLPSAKGTARRNCSPAVHTAWGLNSRRAFSGTSFRIFWSIMPEIQISLLRITRSRTLMTSSGPRPRFIRYWTSPFSRSITVTCPVSVRSSSAR